MTANTFQISDIAASRAWNALARHHDQISTKHLRELFAEDPARGSELAVTVGDLCIDYSKHGVVRVVAGRVRCGAGFGRASRSRGHLR
jgi:glucose-6-phosphate isomerase